jgi:hypothetical protein
MKTKIKTVHEEYYSDNTKVIGILFNYSIEGKEWNDSNPYIFIMDTKIYIFFEKIIDVIDYLLYGENRMKRAYLSEFDFDKFYESKSIDGSFSDKLEWLTT